MDILIAGNPKNCKITIAYIPTGDKYMDGEASKYLRALEKTMDLMQFRFMPMKDDGIYLHKVASYVENAFMESHLPNADAYRYPHITCQHGLTDEDLDRMYLSLGD